MIKEKTMIGKIKTLIGDKGFGFITTEKKIDYFFHRTDLMPGLVFEELRMGDKVEFEATTGRQGKTRATNVSLAI